MTEYWATEDLPAHQWTDQLQQGERVTTREKRDLRNQGLDNGQLNRIRTIKVREEYL